MEIFVTLVILVAMAYWCYTIAKKNGRDLVWAVIWGVLGGIFAVIVYAIIGKTSEQRDKDIQAVIDRKLEEKK